MKKCVFRVGTVTYQDIKMWGKCVVIMVVYSSANTVTTGMGTKVGTHWRKLIKLPEDTNQASEGDGAFWENGGDPGWVKRPEEGAGAREQLWQKKETKKRVMHSGSSCWVSL